MVLLEAIAAPVMPHTKLVPGARIQEPIWEFRTYSSPLPLRLLNQSGIRVVRESRSKYIFPFESLEARQRAWTALASDPQWTGLHPTHISLYRRLT